KARLRNDVHFPLELEGLKHNRCVLVLENQVKGRRRRKNCPNGQAGIRKDRAQPSRSRSRTGIYGRRADATESSSAYSGNDAVPVDAELETIAECDVIYFGFNIHLPEDCLTELIDETSHILYGRGAICDLNHA